MPRSIASYTANLINLSPIDADNQIRQAPVFAYGGHPLSDSPLQPLLKDMMGRHPDIVRDIFGGHHNAFAEALNAGKDDLLDFAADTCSTP
jgi:hypothetical protein